MNAALRIHPDDDLIVALRHLNCGEVIPVNGTHCAITESIPAKQKFAARNFSTLTSRSVRGPVTRRHALRA